MFNFFSEKPAAPKPVLIEVPTPPEPHPFKAPTAVLKDAVLDPFAREMADGFFRSTAGVSFLDTVAAMRPPILESAKVAAGYELCLTNILTLLRPIPKEEVTESSNYPDLEDASKWSDNEPK